MQRREFLGSSAIFGGAAATPLVLSSSAFAAALPASIVDMDALTLSRAIHDGQVRCYEVMEAYLAHIARHNPVYNAIVGMPERDVLLHQARLADDALGFGNARGSERGDETGDDRGDRGWMHGFPFAVKDLRSVAGLRHTSGSLMFAERVAEADDMLAARLRAAGVVFVGKTNTPEFGLGSQSYNGVFGATGSAWNPELTAGGSSGGAGSGLGTHMLPVADGSDMMGSLRNPGAFNNVIGFRPSTNVISGQDAEPRPLTTLGPMGRNVADTIALLDTIAARKLGSGFSPLDLSGVRIAWLGDLGGYLAMEPGIVELCEAGLRTVAEAGAEVEAAMPQFTPSDLWECWTTLRHSGRRRSARQYYDDPELRPLMKPELVWEVEQSLLLTAEDEANARRIRAGWLRELERLFGEYDFIALPTAQVFPFPKEVHWPAEVNGRAMDTYHRWMEVVIPASLGGIPVINLPVGFDERDRPMGMQVMGRYGADRKVLEFGLAYEQITSFLGRRPLLQSV